MVSGSSRLVRGRLQRACEQVGPDEPVTDNERVNPGSGHHFSSRRRENSYPVDSISQSLQIAACPPSTTSAVPMQYDASSDASQRIAAAHSSAVPARPMGIWSLQ